MSQPIGNPSLNGLIAQQAAAAPPAVVVPAPAQAASALSGLATFQSPPPAANAVSVPVAPAPSPQMQPVYPDASQPASPFIQQPAPVQAPSTQPAEHATSSSFADILREQENFTSLPQGMSNEDVARIVGRQIDDANRMEAELEALRAVQQPTAPTAPAAPAMTPAPVADPQVTIPSQLSADAEALAQSGLVGKDASGAWIASNPAFQSFADEHNRFEAHRQRIAQQLVSDPDSFLRDRFGNLGVAKQEDLTTLVADVQSLREQISSQHQAGREAEMQSFLETNKQQLFVGGDTNQPTEYTQKYNAFAKQIHDLATGMGQELENTQIHARTLSMLSAAGIHLQPTQPHVPQPAAPAAQYQQPQPAPAPQSFMQQAAQTAPQTPVNRLPMTEYPSQSPGEFQVPIGPGGKPDLIGIINHQNLNGTAY